MKDLEFKEKFLNALQKYKNTFSVKIRYEGEKRRITLRDLMKDNVHLTYIYDDPFEDIADWDSHPIFESFEWRDYMDIHSIIMDKNDDSPL